MNNNIIYEKSEVRMNLIRDIPIYIKHKYYTDEELLFDLTFCIQYKALQRAYKKCSIIVEQTRSLIITSWLATGSVRKWPVPPHYLHPCVIT